MMTGMRPFYGIPVYDARRDFGDNPSPEDIALSRMARPAAPTEVVEDEDESPTSTGGTVATD